MLAYGNSRRTLRFSYQGDLNLDTIGLGHQVGHKESDKRLDKHLDSSGPNGPRSRPVHEARDKRHTPGPKHISGGLLCAGVTPSEDIVEMDRRKSARQGTGPTYLNGSGGLGGSARPVGPKKFDTAPAGRPKFRLNLDLGSDSDSSVDDGKGYGGYHRRVSSGGQEENSQPAVLGRGPGSHSSSQQNPQRDFQGAAGGDGIEHQHRNRGQGDVRALEGGGGAHSGSYDRDWLGRSVTPNSAAGRNGVKASGGRWPDSEEGARYEAGRVHARRTGGGEGGSRDGVGNWSQATFVTPDHPAPEPMERSKPSLTSDRPTYAAQNPYLQPQAPRGSSPATTSVTPDLGEGNTARSQRRAFSTETTKSSRATNGPCEPLDEPEGRVDREGSGLRRSPSLVTVQDVYPPELSRIWPFGTFNAIQSALYPTVAKTDSSIVVAAPTGCGKTVVLEMAIARLLHESGMNLVNQKIIYIAPIKALCQQTLDDWTAKFSPLGVRLAELTSDSASGPSKGAVPLRDLASADIILTTPEKWDSVTRRWKEHSFLVGTVALVLVDEVHTIGEERGATLEVILTRMKMVSRSPEVAAKGLPASRMRFIALSATLPNATDIGAFIRAEVFSFGEEYRPVPLQTHVVGYATGSNPFLFDRGLSKHVPGMVARYSNGKPTLIFCGSKKDTETLAGTLAQGKDYARGTRSQVIIQYLSRAADNAEDPQLGKLIRKGVAIHNSGLSPGDRGLVERAFLSGSLAVLVATTTLAMGVNLPARLVIIKGTNHYRGAKGYQELPKSAILQMMGRAGRPGFDSSGVAVVMTSQANKKHLERLSAGQEAVESSLRARLLEALNSEVCQGETIHDIGEAMEWMKSTFYFIRCQKNPKFYGLPTGLADGGLYDHVQKTCLNGLKKLREAGVVDMDEDEFCVTPTPQGVLFSRFMVRFDSMKAIMSVSEETGIKDVLDMCASCEELNVPVRRTEKRFLNDLNKQVRYPPPKKAIIRTPADKALVLMQAALGCLPLEDWTLRNEQASMLDVSARLLGCCAESLAVCGRGGGLGCAVSLRLARSVRLKMWMDAELGQLRQLPGIGETMCLRLGGNNIITLVDLARTSSAKVDTLAGRKHPFGHGLRHSALHLLSKALTASVSRHQLENGKEELQVRVELAFQSLDPFGASYIEAPDAAHAPPPTGWRRHDTNFQLLVYYDRPMGNKGSTEDKNTGTDAGEKKPVSRDTDGLSMGTCSPGSRPLSVPSGASPSGQGSLLLFRKVSSESVHSTTLPPEATATDLTIHLWLICSGVCGMDIADIRMKPSTLDDHFVGVQELRQIWSHDGRASHGDSSENEEAKHGKSASDRKGWSEWEQNDASTSKARVEAVGHSPPGGHNGSKRKADSSDKAAPGISRDLPSASRGWEQRGGKAARGARASGAGGGRRAEGGSEPLRQMDIASSFKAGAQRSLSDSARKRVKTAGSASDGLTRGDLGAIGVSEAGDSLGVSQSSRAATPSQPGYNASTNTPSQQRSRGRTWSSMSKGSGSVVSGSSSLGNPSTYNPEGTAMRTVLRQKGSEMNLSSRVGVDRLRRSSGVARDTAATTPSASTGTSRRADQDVHAGPASGGRSSGHVASHERVVSGEGALDDGDGGAVVALASYLSGSPEVPQHRYQDQHQQEQQAIDFASFSYKINYESSTADALTPSIAREDVIDLAHSTVQQLQPEQQGQANAPRWRVPTAVRGGGGGSGAWSSADGVAYTSQAPQHQLQQQQHTGQQQQQRQHQQRQQPGQHPQNEGPVAPARSPLSTNAQLHGANGGHRVEESWNDSPGEFHRGQARATKGEHSSFSNENGTSAGWVQGVGGGGKSESYAGGSGAMVESRMQSEQGRSGGIQTSGPINGWHHGTGMGHGGLASQTSALARPLAWVGGSRGAPLVGSSDLSTSVSGGPLMQQANPYPASLAQHGAQGGGGGQSNTPLAPIPLRPYTSPLPVASAAVPGNRTSSHQHQRQKLQLPPDGVHTGGAIAVRVQRAADRTGVPAAPGQAASAMPTASTAGLVAQLGTAGGGVGAAGSVDTAAISSSGVQHGSWTGRADNAGVQSNDHGRGHGGWFDFPRPDTDGNDFFGTNAWTSSLRDVVSDQPAGTVALQPTMAPIRPATPPTMQRLDTRATAGAGVSVMSGGVAGGGGGRGEHGDRQINREGECSTANGGGGPMLGEGLVGQEGVDKGAIGGNIAKRLDFHDIFS